MKIFDIFIHFLILVLLNVNLINCMSLEEVTDIELVKLINQEQYVLVLFSDDSDASQDMETELASVREDLVETINAWVVKAVKSKLKDSFNPGQAEPQVVFFRKAVPVLYTGPADEEIILETLMLYKDQCVQSLTDTSFEHLTQVATGATTGDWLIMFFKDECQECELLRARLETVACKNRGRINVARINKETTGAVTARRFGSPDVPAFIFFRLGKMYHYTLEKYDVDSLDSFVNGWYKNVPSQSIPLPKTPFDDVVQMCVDYMREYPLICALAVGFPILLLMFFIYLIQPDKPKPKKAKKKKSDKSEKEKEKNK